MRKAVVLMTGTGSAAAPQTVPGGATADLILLYRVLECDFGRRMLFPSFGERGYYVAVDRYRRRVGVAAQ